jgi:hypothetical protein
MMRSFAALALLAVATCWLHAQTPKPSAAVSAIPQYPVVTLNFGEPQSTPLGKKNWVMLGNSSCAPDGSLFTQMMATPPAKMGWALNSLTDGTDVVRYAASSAPGYKNISGPFKYFATDNAVVTLVAAEPLGNSLAENEKPARRSVTLALVYDRKGTLQRAIPIPPKIDPKSIGMYGSGDLLVITKDTSTNRLRLLVLDHDGDIKNELSLFDYDYEANRKAGKGQPLAKYIDAGESIQIVPHGDNLLLVPQLTQATVIEVNEQGIVRATDIDLPHGYLLRELFPDDGPYWTVSTFNDVKVIQAEVYTYVQGKDPSKPPTDVKVSQRTSPTFHQGPLFQFNSFDGSLVRQINMPEKSTANILCAHDGDFTAVTTDRDTGRIEMLTGSVPR